MKQDLTPERSHLDIGFVPLIDCAPLVVAYEKGFFEAEGLRVTLHRERSWASIRDKTAFGIFDAAQMLYPMPLAMTLGVGGPAEPTVTAVCLDLNGNAITVSNRLFEAMVEEGAELVERPPATAEALRRVVERRRRLGEPPPCFGVVFPTSTHHYELRYWMAAAGVDPDLDAQIIVLPPPDMPEALRSEQIDGFCVGEPWNSYAVHRGWGRTLVTKYDLWNNGPEKVLGVTRRWAEAHPRTHLALVRAVIGACAWCDEPDNRAELAGLIASRRYVDAPVEVVRMSMLGQFQHGPDVLPRPLPDFNVFHRYAANFPWRSHAIWFLTQMVRWGHLDPPADYDATAAAVLMPEVYRAAAASLGAPAPTTDYKPEGVHHAPWTLTEASAPIEMGPDRFLDGGVFNPFEPDRYLQGLAANHRSVVPR